MLKVPLMNSNTTFVKVKSRGITDYELEVQIQIQHLLKLNFHFIGSEILPSKNSNTTFVKVKC